MDNTAHKKWKKQYIDYSLNRDKDQKYDWKQLISPVIWPICAYKCIYIYIYISEHFVPTQYIQQNKYLQPITKHTAKKKQNISVVLNLIYPIYTDYLASSQVILCTILLLLKTAYFYDHVLFQYPQIQQNVLDIIPKFLNLTHCSCHQGGSYIFMVLQITYPVCLLITLIFFNMYIRVKNGCTRLRSCIIYHIHAEILCIVKHLFLYSRFSYILVFLLNLVCHSITFTELK
jgi:hypothetical protein